MTIDTAAPNAPTNAEGVSFMVIDDDPVIVHLIGRALRPLGKVAFTQDFARAAITVLEARPRVVFLDVDLPVVTGVEIARQIRSNPELDEVHIVMITSHHGDAVSNMIAGVAVDKILQKPLDMTALHALAGDMLAHKRVGERPPQTPGAD